MSGVPLATADQEAHARYHALMELLDAIAPRATLALDAVQRFPKEERPYGRMRARVLDEERERLVKMVRQAHREVMQGNG